MKRSHLLTAAAGAMASMVAPAYAITVGEARVLSYTDQPLRVLIPIKAQSWEWRAMWASAQTYQHGLGLTATLYKPTAGHTDGVIEIRSRTPITEPIVDLQITFETGHRTTVHRTPILIDAQRVASNDQQATVSTNPLAAYEPVPKAIVQQLPLPTPTINQTTPKMAPIASSAPPVARPMPNMQAPVKQGYSNNSALPEIRSVITPPNQSVRASNYEAPPAFAPASVRASQDPNIPLPPSLSRRQSASVNMANTERDIGEGQYTVRRGDGLYSIANRNKPALWSVDETMAHIFKNNRHAFAGSTYKTLKAGSVLTFSWAYTPKQIEQSAPQIVRAPILVNQYQAPQESSRASFTEDDARAAVLRYRMTQMQQELKTLQRDRTR